MPTTAFTAHVQREQAGDNIWHTRYCDLLAAVNHAAGTPDNPTDDLISRLLFERDNGICNTDWGCIASQIGSWNTCHPENTRRMPTCADFRPFVSAMLTRRNNANPLTQAEYLNYWQMFHNIVGMNLQVVFNRLVIAMFPEQFVTPAKAGQIEECLDALVNRRFVTPFTAPSQTTKWFDVSSYIARELRARLAEVQDLDPAYLSSFVWAVGITHEA